MKRKKKSKRKTRIRRIRRSDFYLIPNILTMSRVIAIPLIAVLIYYNWNLMAVFVFAMTGVSDYIDGWVARKYGHESKLGMLLDPLADKLVVLSTMIMLLWKGRLSFEIVGWQLDWVPPLLVIGTVGREIAITGIRSIASTAGIVIPASRGGKLKTWFQFFAIAFILTNLPRILEIGQGMLVISVVIAVLSGIQYTVKFVRNLPQ